MASSHLVPPSPQRDWAYFLDFDGTLVDIADKPESVRVEQKLVGLLADLDSATGGAVVLVSGRPIADLDSHLKPLKLRAAGLHGLEYRVDRDGPTERCGLSPAALDPVRPTLASFAASHEGVQIEDKGISLAVHFRRAPTSEAEARSAAESACRELGPAYVCLAGKMVYEIKPRDAHKGQVIERFMKLPSLSGRRPIFVGDDITDEDGFRVCNARGGISVRVGDSREPTLAGFRLANVEQVEDWLGEAITIAKGANP